MPRSGNGSSAEKRHFPSFKGEYLVTGLLKTAKLYGMRPVYWRHVEDVPIRVQELYYYYYYYYFFLFFFFTLGSKDPKG